jgi:serine phosphatase RsbU (regulator of sigma subunit)/predicted ester cyclase
MARRIRSQSRGEAVTKLKKSGAESNLKVICTRLMTADEIRAVLARRADGMLARDPADAASNYSEDCVLESGMYGPGKGRAYVESVFRMFFSAFPDITFEFHEAVMFGSQAIQLTTARGTDTGGFLGQRPTGKPFSVLAVFMMTFEKNLIVHERRIYDRGGWLLQLAGDASQTLESVGLYRSTLDRAVLAHEVLIASQIQRALLPPPLFTGAGFEVAAASIPCRTIGGDFVDYFDLPNGAFGFVLGDIAGKGPPAALLAGVLQGILAAYVPMGGTPAKTLHHVNDVLLRRTTESRFATLIYGRLEVDGQLTYCNAGHNPPMLIGQQGRQRLDKGGLILGAFKDAVFDEGTVQLHPGEAVVVFSDGVTEAVNDVGEEFGEDRLWDCLEAHRHRSAADQLQCLFEALRRFTDHAPQHDDVTALVLRYLGAGSLPAA